MIVYNKNPEGTKPIQIITDWEEGINGGPAIYADTFSIAPGQGIDLEILGLFSQEEVDNFQHEKLD